MSKCICCNVELNVSIYSKDHKFKSCPRCSVLNGSEHVFLRYPQYFGTTKFRKTKENPDGAQSYCIVHRGNLNSEIPKHHVKCTDIEKYQLI